MASTSKYTSVIKCEKQIGTEEGGVLKTPQRACGEKPKTRKSDWYENDSMDLLNDVALAGSPHACR